MFRGERRALHEARLVRTQRYISARQLFPDHTCTSYCASRISKKSEVHSPNWIGQQVTGELKVARKYPGCAEQAQREIYRWMREGLSTGKHVVRLKIGDPFIFGRGGEEVLEMRELGVEPKVVPGISSVFSAPLLGGVPVTHRGVATQVGDVRTVYLELSTGRKPHRVRLGAADSSEGKQAGTLPPSRTKGSIRVCCCPGYCPAPSFQ